MAAYSAWTYTDSYIPNIHINTWIVRRVFLRHINFTDQLSFDDLFLEAKLQTYMKILYKNKKAHDGSNAINAMQDFILLGWIIHLVC